jgi:DNA-binding transcriptional ArsR family regulator
MGAITPSSPLSGVTRLRPRLVGAASGPRVLVRLCLSPMASTIASLLEVTSTCSWEASADGWRRIAEESDRSVAFTELLLLARHPTLLRLLAPRVDGLATGFASQLYYVGEAADLTPHDETSVVGMCHQDLPHLGATQSLNELCEGLLTFHDRIIGPRWTTMRTVLDREILRQSYAIATSPLNHALNQLHPRLRYQDGLITVDRLDGSSYSIVLGHRPLVLAPAIADRTCVIADKPGHIVTIAYGAPGARAVWSSSLDHDRPPSQLAEMLGEKRAVILAQLATPATTSGLCDLLELAPATIADHLKILHRLGLIDRTRVGRYVYYRRSSTGDRLAAVFEG